jgi:hypothetical protein
MHMTSSANHPPRTRSTPTAVLIDVARSVRSFEGNHRSVWRPIRVDVPAGGIREAPLVAAVRVHHVNLIVACRLNAGAA